MFDLNESHGQNEIEEKFKSFKSFTSEEIGESHEFEEIVFEVDIQISDQLGQSNFEISEIKSLDVDVGIRQSERGCQIPDIVDEIFDNEYS